MYDARLATLEKINLETEKMLDNKQKEADFFKKEAE